MLFIFFFFFFFFSSRRRHTRYWRDWSSDVCSSDLYNWDITLPGGGHSSPVLWGDRIFLTCSDKETANRTVLCIHATDGSIIWKREFKSHPYPQHADNDYASSTPAVDEKHVYICWSVPEEYSLTCLDHDGKDV